MWILLTNSFHCRNSHIFDVIHIKIMHVEYSQSSEFPIITKLLDKLTLSHDANLQSNIWNIRRITKNFSGRKVKLNTKPRGAKQYFIFISNRVDMACLF